MSLGREVPLNPRYVNYCRAHGLTPDQMHRHDQAKYPGGIMTGFLLWSRDRLFDCRKQHPEYFLHGNLINHDGYDRWLYDWASRADSRLAKVEKARTERYTIREGKVYDNLKLRFIASTGPDHHAAAKLLNEDYEKRKREKKEGKKESHEPSRNP